MVLSSRAMRRLFSARHDSGGKSASSWSTRQNFGESGGFVSIVYHGRENTVGTVSTVCDQLGHAALTMLTMLTQMSLSGKSR